MQRLKERAELTNLLLLHSRIATARGDHDGARTSAQDALAEARHSGPYFILKSAAALCELPDATDADFDRLSQAYGALPEEAQNPVRSAGCASPQALATQARPNPGRSRTTPQAVAPTVSSHEQEDRHGASETSQLSGNAFVRAEAAPGRDA